MSTPYDLCLVTAGDRATADRLAAGLVERRLAACVTVLPGAESVYRWEGAVERAAELLLLVKTRRDLRAEVIRFVKENHPYSVPETIFTEIAAGGPEYLGWLGANTAAPADAAEDKAPEKEK